MAETLNKFTESESCAKFESRKAVVESMDRVNVLLSKVATEQAQAKKVFEDIEDYIAEKTKKVQTHK